MKNRSIHTIAFLVVLGLLVGLIAGCATNSPAPTSAPPAQPAAVQTSLPATPTKAAAPAPPTATAAPLAAAAGATREITNTDGKKLTIPADVQRVACLYGPSYEKVALLGAEDKIVLASDQASISPWAEVIYKRGKTAAKYPGAAGAAMSNLNVEELLKTKAQLAFYWSNSDQLKKLSEVGIAAVYPGSGKETFDGMKDALKVYAAVFGEAEQKKAATYNDYFNAKKQLVSSRLAGISDAEKPTVFFAVRKSLQTAGNKTAIPEMIDLAGGKCVTSAIDGGFGLTITMEQFVAWNPDFIILDQTNATSPGTSTADKLLSDIAGEASFKGLKAVKNKQVYVSPTGVFFWNAGQQQILQLVWLAKTLHPDQFKDIDMAKELKEYYSTFYQYNLTDDQVKRILAHEAPAS